MERCSRKRVKQTAKELLVHLHLRFGTKGLAAGIFQHLYRHTFSNLQVLMGC